MKINLCCGELFNPAETQKERPPGALLMTMSNAGLLVGPPGLEPGTDRL